MDTSSPKVPDFKSSTAVNLCQEVLVGEEMTINYRYTDTGKQLMILNIGAPGSISGILWMTQYLAEYDLNIEDMKSVKCNQPFVFGPSKRYISTSLVELPIFISRMDGKEDILVVQMYLLDAEVPFLCGTQTLEAWNFKINGTNKILEIKTRAD